VITFKTLKEQTTLHKTRMGTRHRLFRTSGMMMLLVFAIGAAMESDPTPDNNSPVSEEVVREAPRQERGGVFDEAWKERVELLGGYANDMVTVMSLKDETFKLEMEKSTLAQSVFLNAHVEKCLDHNDSEDIPVDVEPHTLQLVANYMKHHAEHGLPPKIEGPLTIPMIPGADNTDNQYKGEKLEGCTYRASSTDEDGRPREWDEAIWTWDAQFMDGLSQDEVFDLLLAANYLNHEALLQLCEAKVASGIKGQTEEQIYENFEIPKDDPITPEERAYVEKNNMHFVEPEKYEQEAKTIGERILGNANLIELGTLRDALQENDMFRDAFKEENAAAEINNKILELKIGEKTVKEVIPEQRTLAQWLINVNGQLPAELHSIQLADIQKTLKEAIDFHDSAALNQLLDSEAQREAKEKILATVLPNEPKKIKDVLSSDQIDLSHLSESEKDAFKIEIGKFSKVIEKQAEILRIPVKEQDEKRREKKRHERADAATAQAAH